MEFLKRNYEKILLSVILLALAVVAFWLIIQVGSENAKLEEIGKGFSETPHKKINPVDTKKAQVTLDRVKNPGEFALPPQHRLFNSMKWVRQPDGKIQKITSSDKIGIPALKITNIAPLNLVVSFVAVSDPTAPNVRYQVGVTREAAIRPADRRQVVKNYGPTTRFVIDTNLTLTMKAVRGTPAEPSALVMELIEGGGEPAEITVTTAAPFQKVAGYVVDARYDLENKTFTGKRLGDPIFFNGETNNIVAITNNQVVVSSQYGKRFTLKYAPAP